MAVCKAKVETSRSKISTSSVIGKESEKRISGVAKSKNYA